jgi:hypothetical protein
MKDLAMCWGDRAVFFASDDKWRAMNFTQPLCNVEPQTCQAGSAIGSFIILCPALNGQLPQRLLVWLGEGLSPDELADPLHAEEVQDQGAA